MALAGRQIRQLRALAHHLDATVSIGKSGVVEGTATQVVEVIGHKFTLYRVSSREDAKHIELD